MGRKKYLVISIGKSGSNWLNNIIGALPGIEKLNMGRHGITGVKLEELEILKPGQVMYCHLQHTDQFIKEIARQNIAAFYIYRDLRDCLVSEYFHKAYMDRDRFVKVHPILNEVDDKTAFDLENILRWSTIAPFYADVPKWLNDDLPAIKFEDLISSPGTTLAKALDQQGMAYSEKAINKALEAASFVKMSGGRSNGEENRLNHYRKGVVGDWKNYFSQAQNDALVEKFQNELSQLGYL